MPTTVDYHEYDPGWRARFVELSDPWLLPASARADHVGSTAVPGLSAKNCIDILIRAGKADHDAVVAELVRHGFEERPWIAEDPDRRFLRLIEDGRRVSHVHLTTWDHPGAKAQLAARDLLRVDAGWRTRYADIKSALAAAHPDDRGAYIDGKNDFVVELTHAALERQRTLIKRKLPTLGGPRYRATEIETDDDGTWLLIPEGSPWRSSHASGAVDHDIVVLIPSRQPWVAWWVTTSSGRELRVDLCRPPVLEEGTWSFVDLELDVFAYPDEDRVELLDQADLEEQLQAGAIAPSEAAATSQAAHELMALIASGKQAWPEHGWSFLASLGA